MWRGMSGSSNSSSLFWSRSFSGPNEFGMSSEGSWRAGARLFPKAVFDLPTTRDLIERLEVDSKLRRLYGWSSARAVPSDATFSRAFAEFALSSLPGRLHEALIKRTTGGHLVGHILRDATAIEERDKPAPKPPETPKPNRKRGRPRKGEERVHSWHGVMGLRPFQ